MGYLAASTARRYRIHSALRSPTHRNEDSSTDPGVRRLDEPPSLPRMYARAVTTGLVGRGDELPDRTLALPKVPLDRPRLASYRRVCGFPPGDGVPATYPHVLAFPLALRLMTGRAFPLPVLGLVHVANRITQHRPISASDVPALRVRAERLRAHPKGTQFDLVSELRVDAATVWTGVSTYLRRGDDSGGSVEAPAAEGEEGAAVPPTPKASWRVEGDVSRRYAGVSGDRNPHHLHPLLARLFGFPRLLAHGMWMKARCLAAFVGELPEGFTVEASFRRPLLLPSTVTLRAAAADGGWAIALCDVEGGTPHLTGSIEPLAESRSASS